MGDVYSDRLFCSPFRSLKPLLGKVWSTSWLPYCSCFGHLDPNLRYNHHLKEGTTESSSNGIPINMSGLSWFWRLAVTAFLQSMTWLPTMAVQAGLSKVESGLLASVFTLISLPVLLDDPKFNDTLIRSQSTLDASAIVVGAGILGVAMLLIPTSNFFYWLVLNALIGSSVSSLFPYLMVAFSMKSSTPEKTAQLSGLCPNRRLRLCSLCSHPLRLLEITFSSWTPAILMLLV